MLVTECRKARVEIKTTCTISDVRRADLFEIETNYGHLKAEKLVVACGGLSFPKIGASDFGYLIARQFGLKVVETRPSLVALALAGENLARLSGVSIDSHVSAGKQTFRENILFTHRGLSGPAILQVSNYWRRGEPVTIDLLPEIEAVSLISARRDSRQTLVNFIGSILPQRFANAFVASRVANKPLNQLTDREIDDIGRGINAWQVYFRETEGYGRAEVTLGGVSTDELSSKTMEAKKAQGLYFIGEVVDVTGWLGGYNFQWAWSSAYAAGNAI